MFLVCGGLHYIKSRKKSRSGGKGAEGAGLSLVGSLVYNLCGKIQG